MDPLRDEIRSLIEDLAAYPDPIIVEGKKDVRALESAGITAREFKDSADIEIEKLARAGAERILVLTDKDRRGLLLRDQIMRACERVGITCDRTMRARFFSVTKLRQVEGFDTLCGSIGIDTDKKP